MLPPSPCASATSSSVPASAQTLRRNESAAATLQSLQCHINSSSASHNNNQKNNQTKPSRRNKSYSALSDLNQAEKESSHFTTNGSRKQVCTAVAVYIDRLIAKAANEKRKQEETVQEDKARVTAISEYIDTICKQLDLPNSCIVAMLIYLVRLGAQEKFDLTAMNWQPSILAGFVIAAKLCFDEPVWNEDFVRALRISNVTVSQISRWEANFLQLIHYNTNIVLTDYASACFQLQQSFFAARGQHVQFFSFLMLKAQELAEKESL